MLKRYHRASSCKQFGGATISLYRYRGLSPMRLKVVIADVETYVVDLASNSFDFTNLAPAGVI